MNETADLIHFYKCQWKNSSPNMLIRIAQETGMESRAKILLLLILISSSNCATIFNYPLIKEYLFWNNINVALFITCERFNWTEDQNVMANFKNDDIWMNMRDMSNVKNSSVDQFLLRSGYTFCVIVDWNCSDTMRLLNEISTKKMFHYERYWLMFGTNAEQMFKTLSGELINIDAEVAVVVPVNKTEYEIKEVYNPSCKTNGRFRMDNVGSWNESVGLTIYGTKTKFDRRHNLAGSTFMAEITIPKLPKSKTFMEYIDSDECPFMDTKERGNYRVFQVLMQMFNFNVKIRRGKIWGARQKDGFWIGVVGSLNRSEIDLSISSLRWENDRYDVLDQTTDTFYINNLFIFRHPVTVNSLTVFISPFDRSVWLLTFVTGVLVSIFFQKVFIVKKKLHSISSTSCASIENESSYDNSFLMVFGFLFQQGHDGSPLFASSPVLVLTYLLFSLLIYQFYCSFIVGSLLTQTPKTIKTMKQLLHSNLDLAMDELPYIQDIFQYNTEESAVTTYKKIMAQPSPLLPLYKGLNLVKKGTLAFNTDGINAYPILKTLLTDNEVCDLQEVKYVEKLPTGPGLPKKSPLRELVKIGIRKLYETGILAKIWSIWIAKMPKCSHSHSSVDLTPVDLVHFSSALLVLTVGFLISLVVLIGEQLHSYCLKEHQKN